ncbi:MAG: site-specific integrase [Pseudomonadales bacterium]|nr:site-specific integrase [Pseudomonadales bacterium]
MRGPTSFRKPKRLFRDAASYYLQTNQHLSNLNDYTNHLNLLDPYIGDLPLDRVHLGTLQPFIDARRQQGVKTKTINLALATVRRILNLAARLWRDDQGLTWLESAPLIQLLRVNDAREPYPLSWEEQGRLFTALPDHLQQMCLFKVNTGCRDREVTQLRWDWEFLVPQLSTSIFVIPGNYVKNREDRLIVLNRVASEIIEKVRGNHPDYVFTYKGNPIERIGNNGWKRAREKAGLENVRVHDLKHTFGRRLRAAGVSLETRKVLLGHRNGDITTHYSAPEVEELITAANKVCEDNEGNKPELLIIRRSIQASKP